MCVLQICGLVEYEDDGGISSEKPSIQYDLANPKLVKRAPWQEENQKFVIEK